MRGICYGAEVPSDDVRKKTIEDHKAQLDKLNAHLETHKFFAGDYSTIADIAFYETF